VASAVPAIRLLRADIAFGLKDGGPSLGESRRTGQIRTAFVIFQAAFAVILLTGTGLLVRSFDRLMHEDLGFDPTGKVKVWIGRPDRQNEKPEELMALFERIQHQLGALPGVRGVSFGQDALLAGGGWKEDEMRMKDGTYQPVSFTLVGSDYPQTAGLTLRSGRWFSDRPKTTEVVVNEALAKQRFGTADPVGQMITLKNMGSDPRPVVGVVKDTKESASSAADARCFGAISLQPNRIGTLLLRLDRDPPPEFSDQVRRAAFAVDDRLFLSNLEPASQLVVNSRWAENYASRILKGLSAIALGLTIVGIFSVLAYTVDSRKSEFGVRLALGETPAGLNHLVMRRGLAAAGTGVLVGLAGAAGLTQLISGMLYRTSSYDPLVYASVSLVLLLAAALACWIPARRASRVDVVELLKAN